MVFIAFAERRRTNVLFNSGINILFFCKLGLRALFPVGLNCVARVRFEYPPPTIGFLPVISHFLAISGKHVIIKEIICKDFMDIETITFIILLIISVILHEIAHGYMANLLGDPTAKLHGRLTLNPFSHVDLFGSIVLPAFLVLSGSPILFGWAKPVPYNPYNLTKGGRLAEALVAFAGPLANLAIAFFAATLFKIGLISLVVAQILVYMNLFLAFLNLIPLPPLDGSKIWPALLPLSLRHNLEKWMSFIERGGAMTMVAVLIVLSLFFAKPLAELVAFLSSVLL